MSAPTDITVTTPANTVSTTAVAPPAKVDVKAEDKTDWKAEARKWEQRAKDNTGAADELAKLKQAQMSDQERLTAELTEAQQRADRATSEALRFRVAARYQISDDDADTFLTGSDEPTLLKQAERLQALAATVAGQPAPRADLSQGAKGTAPAGSPEQEFANFLGEQLRG